MPVYYHIHRGDKLIKFDKNKPMFVSKKNSFWYNVEKQISNNPEYKNSYCEYKITINNDKFTHSLNSKDNTKILKLNENNLKKFIEKYPSRNSIKKDFGGLDATDIRYRPGNGHHYHDELFIIKWTKGIKVEFVGRFKQ